MKQWEKPTLVILVRGKPEERILSSCKTDSTLTGPNTSFGTCNFSDIPAGCLYTECATVTSS